MESKKRLRSMITACVFTGVLLLTVRAGAELKPGDTLDQSTWQEAKGLMPEAILKHFANGHHISKIIELPPEAIQWGSRHRELTETNQGKYDIDARGVLMEKSTGTWPRYYPGGFPFAYIDPNDPKAAYKIMYNFANRGGPIDDADFFINMFWVDEKELNRYIDFVGQGIIYSLSHYDYDM